MTAMVELKAPDRVHAASNGAVRLARRKAASPSRPGRSTPTPLRAVIRGVLAGAIGTAAMDTFLFARYRRSGGESSAEKWELSSGLSSWDDAPAPAQMGKRIVEGLFQITLPPSRVPLVNNVMHWGYGLLNGAEYGIVAESLGTPRISYGLAFGATVWAGDYVILPAAKLYQPIWKYDPKTLANDLSAHLVYGVGTATALRLMSR